jgi:hypothetical protein
VTDQDRLLAVHSGPFLLWLEERRQAKVGELTSEYRQGKDTRDKAAELAVLADLISALKAKQQNYEKQRGK